LRTELFWNLEAKYHTLNIADRIAWEATENEEPSDCESDEVCAFLNWGDRQIRYLSLHPNGTHAPKSFRASQSCSRMTSSTLANSRAHSTARRRALI
jgi:hypothetical protein